MLCSLFNNAHLCFQFLDTSSQDEAYHSEILTFTNTYVNFNTIFKCYFFTFHFIIHVVVIIIIIIIMHPYLLLHTTGTQIIVNK
jgi:hypothetical protein